MATITAVWQKKGEGGEGGEEVRPSPLPVFSAKSNKLEETSSVNLICYLALQLMQDRAGCVWKRQRQPQVDE